MQVPRSLSVATSALLVLAAGCRSAEHSPPPGNAARAEPARPAAATNDARHFGAALAPADVVPLGTVLSKPDDFAAKTVTVEAKVRRNCTRRGCWMELAEGMDEAAPGCRVTFKDYGFFVPLDSAGSTAKVQGEVQVRAVPAGEVAHMESEGARFAAKQPDGSAREVRVVASGVELRRGPT